MADIDIMIADDEPHIVRALSFVFERDGYLIATASDGAAALQRIKETKPRVVFLDLIMPKMTGDEVCKAIKQDSALQGIHVVILTCKGQELDRELSIASGADSFITKPFSPKEVLKMVKEILGS